MSAPPAAARHLYVHVPFCARRCSYCDFAIAIRRATPVAEYVSTLELELALRDPVMDALDTVYLGGGTPSRLGGGGVGAVLDAFRRRVQLAPSAEVTIEANPDDVTAPAAAAWRRAGVTRVSLGVQSFDSGVLAWMHRTHDSAQPRAAVAALRDAGIADVSVDLIFALPDAVPRDWARDLEQALSLEPSHVSLYGLTVEPHTPLGRWRDRGLVAEAPEERYGEEFLTAHELMTAAGLEHYEVSNFARPGHRARHNSAYWSGAPYVGVGPSAHGYDGQVRRWNVPAYTHWARRLTAGRDPVAGDESLTPANREAERVYLGLRTCDGLVATGAEHAVARPWFTAGWARAVDGTIVLTPTGWLRLDALAAALTHGGSR